MKQCSKVILLLPLISLFFLGCAQQQVSDRDYVPEIETPLFKQGKGPLLLIDGGHHNFHTLENKFAPFGKVAERNGFRVQSISGKIESSVLKEAKILVIANALNEKNVDNWKRPVYPAFTQGEITQIRNWIWNGGSLFLIADHMPFAGASADLAQSVGFTLYDGFAFCRPNQRFDIFSYANGMLTQNKLTSTQNSVDSIVSFTGHAFKVPDSAVSAITLDSTYKVLIPEVAWEFNKDMKMISAEGLSQLAYVRFGSGKVIVAGEAAMFTAQKAGNIKFGLNAPIAKYNLPLLLNILEWLSE